MGCGLRIVTNGFIARSCSGSARTWRMSIRTIWLCERDQDEVLEERWGFQDFGRIWGRWVISHSTAWHGITKCTKGKSVV